MILLSNASNGTTGPGIEMPKAGNRYTTQDTTFYCTGTFGVGGSVSLEISPDQVVNPVNGGPGGGTPDASSRWLVAKVFTAAGYVTLPDRFRKCRGQVTAGDGTTSITLEAV